MSALLPPLQNPLPEKPPRPRRWIPTSLKMFVASLGLVVVCRSLIPVWNKWTIDQLFQHVRNGDDSRCRALLVESSDTDGLLLDESSLRIAAGLPVISEAMSFSDFWRGTQQFGVVLPPIYDGQTRYSDMTFTVEWGRVKLGRSFWSQPFDCILPFRTTRPGPVEPIKLEVGAGRRPDVAD